ncbi:hypothetical protein Bbelb_073860 [Branchiostoma belcheri]|nr:hypothetical protein Bbelb_073860 [Branchiostoma belcheri]
MATHIENARRAALPTEVLLQIYKSFIRPVLEYGSPVWAGLPRCLSDEVERIQKLCLRICGVPHGYLPTLESRRREASLNPQKGVVLASDSSSDVSALKYGTHLKVESP